MQAEFSFASSVVPTQISCVWGEWVGVGGGDNWQYFHVCMKSQTCYHQMLWLYSMQIQHIHPMHAILYPHTKNGDLLGGVDLTTP